MHGEKTAAADGFREHLERSLGGSFRIERELGGGGMSRVFLAEETALHRRVVVKALSPELTHEVSAERFAREIRLSAGLQHPNIVPVLTAGDADGVPYYTMPYVDGESLRARVGRLAPGERLPILDALDLLRDVARALGYAHRLGVVHRDIKPENVLIGYDAAMVADFGVAKALAAARTQGAASPDYTLTHGGISLGTPAYMAPEQAAGDPAVDHRADLYAWGIVAYEVLTGAHPFAAHRSVQALITAHLTETPRPLDVAAPDVPAATCAVVMRCLAKNADDRPANAEAVLQELGRGTAAGASGAVRQGRTSPLARRLRVGIPLAAAVVLAIAFTVKGARTPGATSPPRDWSASPGYDAYLRGKVRVGSENREDNDGAVTALRQAIAADPGLAPAYASLARGLLIKAFYYATDSEKKRLDEDAEVAVEKALSLDPRLGDAYFARGLMLWTPARRFPHEQAVQAYRQAIALDPQLDEAHHQLALVLLHVGLFDEAEAEVDTALTINPTHTLARFRIGVIALYRGDYAKAYAVFNSTPLESNPSLWAFQMATAQFRLGREAEATALIDKYLKDYPRDEGGVGHSVRAMMLAKAGRRTQAEADIAKAVELGRGFGHFHHTAYNIASAYALLGDHAQAITWLQNAADDGFPCYPLFAADTQLDALRGDPAFIAMMASLKRDWTERTKSF